MRDGACPRHASRGASFRQGGRRGGGGGGGGGAFIREGDVIET